MALHRPARLVHVLLTSPMLYTQRQIAHLAKSITVRTCVDLYPKLSESQPKLFRKGPASGFDVNVNYVDTWSNKSGKPDKVIVAIHGCPDNYTTFTRLIEHFESSNVRVVAPNLPDIRLTRQTGYFWHTTEEKYHFLKDFLAALDIQHIDCLISHSLGVQTIAALWERPGNIQINSFGLFAPQPLWEGQFPKLFAKTVDFAFAFPRSQLWANLLQRAKLHQYTVLYPVNFNSIDQFLWLSTVVYDSKTPIGVEKRFELLVKSGKPVFMLVGSNEPLISKRVIAKLNRTLGISPNEIIHVDPTKHSPDSVPLPSMSSKAITAYVIEKGTHFPHAKYSAYSIPLIENLLQINK